MDTKSEKKLNEILAKDQESLTKPEVAFLRARRSYLNDADTKRYSDLLSEKKETKTTKKSKK